MRENCSKDSTIKLFGKILPLSIESDCRPISELEFRPLKIAEEEELKAENKDFSASEVTEITEKEEENYDDDEDVQNHSTKEPEDSETSTESNVKPKTPPVNEKSTKPKTDKEENGEESNITEEKTLKKPDKILPCPRCKSMDTKFCYYNNYNVHQPRHFCKACQRYWTAGGTMRNIPVGAGRRKTKNSASHYRHLTIFEAHKANGRLLSFGEDSPMCNSMAADKKKPLNGTGNGSHQNRISPVYCKGKENVDDCSSGSVTVASSNEEKGRISASPVLWISGVPWHYQLPLQFYPPIWNYGGWNMPILSPQSSTNQRVSILGKHSRNGETVKPYESDKHEAEKNKNGCVLVPKTLRIDDPGEAAKSSIWTTLGIKNESLNREKPLKAFPCKTEEKNCVPENSPILMANPAALSRSMNFRESS